MDISGPAIFPSFKSDSIAFPFRSSIAAPPPSHFSPAEVFFFCSLGSGKFFAPFLRLIQDYHVDGSDSTIPEGAGERDKKNLQQPITINQAAEGNGIQTLLIEETGTASWAFHSSSLIRRTVPEKNIAFTLHPVVL
ncbi:hypothetical protein [Paenibacillus sp. P32E]|uniref:hypothetical protein n=1 Tax=Paenibacillus sp. P32E TaxID=1349434 RepID=UPI0015BF3394|nr:hypothetical protein [Paenibacillus sp. P32E]